MRASPVDAGHHAGAVVAVVVTQGATAFLPSTLEALAAQDEAPDRIVVVDAGRDTVAVQDAVGLAWPGGGRPLVVAFPGARTFGHAVRAALATLDESDPAGAHRARDGWLWLLHDDSAPRHDALAALLRAVELAPSVAVAGCKQVGWEDPARLVEVGVSTSRYGRRMTDLDDDEVDQGQHDGTDDVLAVGLAGALVRRDVWDALRGPDPALGPYGDGLDLCRRARLAGHRVVVVPQAVVRHAQASLRGTVRRGWDERRSVQARREAFLHGQLVGVPLPLVGVVALLAIGASVVRAGMRLVLKEPHLVLAELVAPWAVLGRGGRLVAARRSAARTSVVRRATLRPLQRSTRDVLRQLRDRRLAAAESRRTRGAPSELEQRELATLRSRRRAGLVVVVIVSVTLTVAAFGTWLSAVVSGARLTGGTLAYGDAGAAQLWADVGSWWVRTGLGHAAPPDPFLAALLPGTAVLGSVGSAAAALVLGALVAAGLGAWFAAGAATRSVALRLWAALAWVATPALLLDLQQVRLGALLTHVSLPWAVLGVARALGVARVDAVQSGLVGAQHVEADPDGSVPDPGLAEAADPHDEQAEVAQAEVAQAEVAQAEVAQAEVAQAEVAQAEAAQADEDAAAAAEPGPDASPGRAVPSARTGPAVVARVPSDPLPEALGGPRQTAEPSFAAAAGAGLALCLVTAGTPALLGAVVLGLLVVAVLRPRRRLWWVAAPPLVLQGPIIAAVVADPGRWRALLAAPGVPVASTAAPVWQQLLGWPSVPAGVLERLGSLPTAVLWIPGAVLALLALLALAVRPPAVRAVRLGWVLAALGGVTGLAVGHIRVGVADGQVTAGWPGGATSLVTAGLVAGALVGAGRVRSRLSSAAFGVRHVAAGILAVIAVLAPLALVTGWVVQLHQDPPVLTASDASVVPAVGVQMQQSGDDVRVLTLAVSGEVHVGLLTGDGRQLTQVQRVVTADQVTGPLGSAAVAAPDDADAELARAAADLTVASGSAADELAALGVGAVLVPPADDEVARTRLAGLLDTTPGLERVTETGAGIVWRVATDTRTVSWARLVRGSAAQFGEVVAAVPADGLTVDTTIGAGAADRLLVLAERSDPGWRAWLDGVQLRSVESGWRQGFEVGASGGHLVVGYESPEQRPWQLIQLVVLGATVLLAVPIRRRRTR